MKTRLLAVALAISTIGLSACGSVSGSQFTPSADSISTSDVEIISSSDPVYVGVCPSDTSSKYVRFAEDLTQDLWDGTHDDSGQRGCVYRFSGTVTSSGEMATESGAVPYVIAASDYGDVLIADMYDVLVREAATAGTAQPGLYETGAVYVLPEIGESADFIATYDCYSDSSAIPTFYLGANEYIVENKHIVSDVSLKPQTLGDLAFGIPDAWIVDENSSSEITFYRHPLTENAFFYVSCKNYILS